MPTSPTYILVGSSRTATWRVIPHQSSPPQTAPPPYHPPKTCYPPSNSPSSAFGPPPPPLRKKSALGLDTVIVELTAKTLSSHLITLERIQFSRQFFIDVKCPNRALLGR
eukprot:427742-Prorocentrum_minimum.AAC.6